MKNKLLILVDKIGKRKKIFADYLNNHGFEATMDTFNNLLVEINSSQINFFISGRNLNNFNLVYVRRAGKDYLWLASVLAKYCNQNGITIVDQKALEKCSVLDEKFNQIYLLHQSRIPIISTEMVFGKNIHKYLSSHDFPVIVKKLSSHRMEDVYLLKSVSDLSKIEFEDCEGLLLQPYLKPRIEYRLLVLGNEVKVAQEKVERFVKDIKICINEEAEEIFLPVDKINSEYKDLAVKSARSLGIDIAGVDLMVLEDGSAVIVEVNRGPGILHDPQKSPELEEITKWLLSK